VANRFWLVTEWIGGGSLKAASAIRALDVEELQYVARSLLFGLDALHKRNLVHRDVKVREREERRSVGKRSF